MLRNSLFNTKHRGLTLIEILIVIAVIALLSAIIISPLAEFRERKILDAVSEDIVSLVNEARINTIGSKNKLEYGAHFETGRMVLFEGTTFTEPNVNNEETIFNSVVEISSISLNGGGSDVVFNKLYGTTDEYGTIIIRLKSDNSKTIQIAIQETGVVYAN